MRSEAASGGATTEAAVTSIATVWNLPRWNEPMNIRKRSFAARALLLGSVGLIAVSAGIGSRLPAAQAATNTAATMAATDGAAPVSRLGPDGSFAPIVAMDRPSVVTVVTRMAMTPSPAADGPQGQMPFDQFFQQFFGQQMPQNGMPGVPVAPMPQAPSQTQEALGSGFIIDPSGLIVTNNHVVADAQEITVTLDDGKDYKAKLIGTDPKTDLALLKIDAGKQLSALQWGNSGNVQAGDRVLAIGNPFGVGISVSEGIVSALGRDLHNGPYDNFLQVDAALNHGNSGGPLVDTSGQVIGIDAAIFTPNNGSVGIGFAIPSDLAQKIVVSLEKNGHVDRGYLGVQIQPVTSDVAAALGLGKAGGDIVAMVEPDTPAAKAGLKQGDVITTVDGTAIADARSLSSMIADMPAGKTVTLGVLRDGKQTEVKATLELMPSQDKIASATDNAQGGSGYDVPTLGLSVEPLTPQLRAKIGAPDSENGLVVTNVSPKSADSSGLRPGDVIKSANNMTVDSASQLDSVVTAAKDSGKASVLLLVSRGGNPAFVAVPIG